MFLYGQWNFMAGPARPNLFGIGARISALASVLVILTAWVMVEAILLPIARQQMVEHEIVDLADETNLLGVEMLDSIKQLRTDMYALTRDATTVQDSDAFRKTATALLHDIKSYLRVAVFDLQVGDDGSIEKVIPVETVDQPKTKLELQTEPNEFFQRILAGDRHVELSEIGIAKIVDSTGDASTGQQSAIAEPVTIVQAGLRVARDPDPGQLNATPQNGPVRVVVATATLIRLNRLARSPRHLLFLRNQDGEYLLHPHVFIASASEDASTQHRLAGIATNLQAGIDELNTKYKSTPTDIDEEFEQSTGYTDKAATLEPYEFYFNSSKRLSVVNDEIIAVLDEIANEHRECGIGKVTVKNPQIKIRCFDEAMIKELCKTITARLAEKNVQVKWMQREPVRCAKFLLHYNRLYFDPDRTTDDAASPRYVDLVAGCSREEIEFDINANMEPVRLTALALTVGAAAIAVVISGFITRPLRKIITSTERFAKGDPNVVLPVRDKGEIGELARSFDHMISQIQERSHELVDREARLSAVLGAAAEGILICGEDGRVQSCNRAAERIFGYSSADAVGKPFESLLVQDSLPLDEAGQHMSGASLLKQLTTGTSERAGLRKDGGTFPLEVSVSEIEVVDGRLFTAIVRDVTSRKESEREIRQLNSHLQELNAHLDQRVRERTIELERTNTDLAVARDEALEANRAKSAFLAQMSHELRTPLNAIIGYSELLIEEAEDNGTESNTGDLKRIIDAGKHLLTLINDILDLAKIEAGRIETYFEPVEIHPFMEGIISTIEPLAQKNRNRLELDCPPDIGVMQADRTRLRQVLFNLLSNACKFTEDGTVSLKVSRQPRDGVGGVAFAVADTGIGLSPEQVGKLFQNFVQVDSSNTRKYGGTGLGLAISRRFCELMGGEVTVESELGRGSTFHVWLPAEKAAEHAPTETPEEPVVAAATPTNGQNTSSGVALVIDDDPNAQELMRRNLANEGFEVVVASNGEEGLALARQLRPMFITLDVMMPRMDGWAVLSALKSDPQLCEIPVVMATIVDNKNLGYALGASDYLTKPIDRVRLQTLIRKYQREGVEKRAVLVIEDSEPTRELLSRLLSASGWLVDSAENGRTAIEHVERARPDLILLDLMMPEMDGFEFLESLRQHEDWRTIPVVVITAKELTPDERKRLSGKVEQVLQKGSYCREDLLREIQELMATSAAGSRSPGI